MVVAGIGNRVIPQASESGGRDKEYRVILAMMLFILVAPMHTSKNWQRIRICTRPGRRRKRTVQRSTDRGLSWRTSVFEAIAFASFCPVMDRMIAQLLTYQQPIARWSAIIYIQYSVRPIVYTWGNDYHSADDEMEPGKAMLGWRFCSPENCVSRRAEYS